ASFTVTAGVPITLEASLFDLEIHGLSAYEGRYTFTPEPGEQQVTLDVALLESTSAISGVFTDGRAFLGSLPVTIRDPRTGFEAVVAFVLREAFGLPVGRTLEFVAQNPSDGLQVTTVVSPSSAAPVLLDLGAGPVPPVGSVATSGTGIATVNLTADPAFPVEC